MKMKINKDNELRYSAEELLTFSPSTVALRRVYQADPEKFKAWLAKNYKGVDPADFLNLPIYNPHHMALIDLKVKK